jgi:glycosyltransferase involved in cell wall biosynthesis
MGPRTKTERITHNIFVHYVKIVNLPGIKVPSFHLQVLFRSKLLIKKYDVSIIHSNNYAAAFASTLVPTVATIHHPAIYEVKQHTSFIQRIIYSADIFFERCTVNRARAVVADSHITKNALEKMYNKPIKIVPCGIDTSLFKIQSSRTIRNEIGINATDVVLFFPGGSRSKRKGAEVLFAALKKVPFDNYRCIVSGSPRGDIGWAQEFRNALRDSGLMNKIILLDEVSFTDLPKYYSAADLVVYPSILEGFGLPALEALSCGKAFIGSRTGEIPYIIKDGHNGILVEVNDVSELQQALEKLMTNKQMRTKLATNARKSVNSYSWDAIAKSIGLIYTQVLEHADE